MSKGILEKDMDMARNNNISPNPIVLKSEVFNFSLAYNNRIRVKTMTKPRFIVSAVKNSSGRVLW
jgi:hypothetical protein